MFAMVPDRRGVLAIVILSHTLVLDLMGLAIDVLGLKLESIPCDLKLVFSPIF
jgi:hypothetical protein